MADKPIEILLSADAWTAITIAGESGTCWIGKKPSKGLIVIAHTDAGVTTGLDQSRAFPVPEEVKPSNVINLVADNASDIFYAKPTNALDGSLLVDVV